RPARVSHDRHAIEVVHPGPPEGTIRGWKARRLDDVGFDPKAGGEAQNRTGVLRNVGLVEGDPHGGRFAPPSSRVNARIARSAKDLCNFRALPLCGLALPL